MKNILKFGVLGVILVACFSLYTASPVTSNPKACIECTDPIGPLQSLIVDCDATSEYCCVTWGTSPIKCRTIASRACEGLYEEARALEVELRSVYAQCLSDAEQLPNIADCQAAKEECYNVYTATVIGYQQVLNAEADLIKQQLFNCLKDACFEECK